MPPSINFAYVFAHASFAENLTIYMTVIVVTVLFILVGLFAHWLDRRDALKIGFSLAPENRTSDTYFYEVAVYTGSRRSAATDSNVKMLMSGRYGDTGIRRLACPDGRTPFRRAGIDTFILSVFRPLGKVLFYLFLKNTVKLYK